MDSYNRKIGAALCLLRKQKGLSRITLSGENTPDKYICCVKQLGKIERGDVTPSVKTLNLLLTALGTNLVAFSHLTNPQVMIDFHRDFSEIWDKCFKGHYDDLTLLLKELKSKFYNEVENPIIKQAILLLDGLMMEKVNNNYHESLNILHQALYITAPNTLKKGKIDYAFISKNTFTIYEYRILKLIALNFKNKKQFHETLKLLNTLCKSLCTNKTDVEIRNRLLPNIYYNLSNVLLSEESYEIALDTSMKGVKHCRKTQHLKVLPLLLYNVAKSHFFQGDKLKAVEVFQQSHQASLINGNTIEAEHTKITVAKKYNIFL